MHAICLLTKLHSVPVPASQRRLEARERITGLYSAAAPSAPSYNQRTKSNRTLTPALPPLYLVRRAVRRARELREGRERGERVARERRRVAPQGRARRGGGGAESGEGEEEGRGEETHVGVWGRLWYKAAASAGCVKRMYKENERKAAQTGG